MTRVRRLIACKDCLVCIKGVIASGHYDQEEIWMQSYMINTLYLTVLPAKTILSLICLLHIRTDVGDDDNHWLWWQKLHRTFLYDGTFDDDDDHHDDDHDDGNIDRIVMFIVLMADTCTCQIYILNLYSTVADED